MLTVLRQRERKDSTFYFETRFYEEQRYYEVLSNDRKIVDLYECNDIVKRRDETMQRN
jgi:hypothetical protein